MLMASLFMAIDELAHNKARHFVACGRSDVNCDAVAARALSVMPVEILPLALGITTVKKGK